MIRPKGLGRGLDALLAGPDDASAAGGESLQTLSLDRLRPGKYQPRSKMDAASLAELADSIREQGVMQPILVRPVDGGRFEIVAGERRWRAAQQAGLREIPALVKNVPDQAALAVALIENIQREDLNPIEEAKGLKRLIDEFGLTHEAAAKAVGRSRSAVSNLLRLNALAGPVQEYLLEGALEMGHARALLALPAAQQAGAAVRVVNASMSVRDAERLVHGLLNPARRAARRKTRPNFDADTARLENDLAERLGAVAHIEPGRKGAGRIVIRYSTLEQLDGLLQRMGVATKS
ncbi:MAG: ParB/RepB/Spo0J family partition protein [Betaproteobacteria bacterium]|nr:ParB/RepB/Spo0J family partition protein [Betaproteobacteria bacterium]MDE2208553.1 ParB/RepB/Spo0J family partition protein [Betaproteobacteria bacterium]MDE2360743.1 ParB/RepB/Spo0J family partition protein [Betaproteobacteria bacterium]